MRGGLVALTAILSSCFTPSVEPCALECGPGSACPPGAVCLADGFCHDGPEEPLCEAPVDAGLPDAALADGGEPDAGDPCGNGVIEDELGEACDDGNTEGGDGCDESCAVELDFVCVGEPSICRERPRDPGDVLVTELLPNPEGMGMDEVSREWFEIHNPTDTAWDLLGVSFADADNDSFTIEASLPIPAGASLVFAGSGEAAENGGIESPDFVFPTDQFKLANDVDEIIVFEPDSSSQVLDRVDYNSNFPIAVGATTSLDPGAYDPAANDAGANWCLGDEVFGDGSGLGTPGEVNPACP